MNDVLKDDVLKAWKLFLMVNNHWIECIRKAKNKKKIKPILNDPSDQYATDFNRQLETTFGQIKFVLWLRRHHKGHERNIHDTNSVQVCPSRKSISVHHLNLSFRKNPAIESYRKCYKIAKQYQCPKTKINTKPHTKNKIKLIFLQKQNQSHQWVIH